MNGLATTITGVLVTPAILVGAVTGAVTGGERVSAVSGWAGDPGTQAAIPPAMRQLYEQAASRFGVPWPLLAAVGQVECGHNTNPACSTPNAAGAVGPMQFLPSTFAAYADASGSPSPSILDPHDAVHAAAALLRSNGINDDPWAALYAYNHADWYVATVLGWALRYGWASGDVALLGRAVLANPRIVLFAGAAADVRDQVVDGRVLALLLVAATSHRLGAVGPFARGHHQCVGGGNRASRPGCTISNHIFGRAVDVSAIDGQPVSVSNHSARRLLDAILALPAPIRPDEVGVPWAEYAPLPGVFTDRDHQHHLHLGFENPPLLDGAR